MRSRNLAVTFVSAAAPGAINTEFAVPHDLGTTPSDAFVARRSGNAKLYRGTTAWTKTTVYFKCDTALGRFVVGLLQ